MTNPLNSARWTRNVPNARNGALKSVQVTLNATPGNVTTVSIPDDALSFRLRPGAAIRFAIDEDPTENIAQESGASVAVSALSVGGIAIANEWVERYLAPGVSRQLRLIGASGSEVVDLEFN